MVGEVIGNYRIVGELGKGGMGMVYRAEHVQLGRPVAVKMLLPQLSHEPDVVQRFFNEARAASAIEHPGIVEVFDFGTHTDGRAYIVMALLRGESLEVRLRRGPLPPPVATAILGQVAGALAAAHARGIVHRDLKPDNIFLVPNELVPGGIQIKLLDFGIAKLADEHASGIKTQTGALMGTPAYMSPEQCMGRSDVDHRTDLYSFGCILFHVLCGRPPFVTTAGAGMMIAAHLRDPAPDPRAFDPSVPPALCTIVGRLLEKDPAARFQSAAELRSALVDAGAPGPAGAVAGRVDSYAATIAPSTVTMTTRSGAAGQMVAPPQHARRGKAWIAVGGVVLAGAVAAVVYSVRSPGSEPAAGPTTPPAPAVAVTAPVAPAPDAAPVPAVPVQPTRAAPPTMASIPARPAPPPVAAPHGPRPSLERRQYLPAAEITVRFAAPVASREGHRTWITVTPVGAAASSYGDWGYIADGARTATIKAPRAAGDYEVRVHADYPVKSTNLVASVAFSVGGDVPGVTPLAEQRFTLATTTVHVGDAIAVKFAGGLVAMPDEKFWLAFAAPGSDDSSYGEWAFVPAAASATTIPAPKTPGDYELRLHANYPTQSTHVVHRQLVHVTE